MRDAFDHRRGLIVALSRHVEYHLLKIVLSNFACPTAYLILSIKQAAQRFAYLKFVLIYLSLGVGAVIATRA